MALNPIAFTEKVVGDFLRYQTTAYAFADRGLHAQMRRLLSLDETRRTPLLKGPFISLARSFRMGVTADRLIEDGILHPHMRNIVSHPQLYGHQETAIRSISARRTTLISTGTGSGKTECFLYPIISRCLELRDQQAPAGVIAVLVYPMNALAEDQLGRLREMLAGTGISFGMYVGKTPRSGTPGERMPPTASRADYQSRLERVRRERRDFVVHPAEERVNRQEMDTLGKQPRILLTNVKQLELLLTRQEDVELFDGALLEFLIFDEAHTYGGTAGAETACLVRRLRAFCGRTARDTVCVATSATLTDPKVGPENARTFASRFFGVAQDEVEVVGEEYESEEWAGQRVVPPALPGDPTTQLRNVLEAVEAGTEAGRMVRAVVQAMTGERIDPGRWQQDLYDVLRRNELCYQMAQALSRPRPVDDVLTELAQRVRRPVSEAELLLWLTLGAASSKDGRSLLRPIVHAFVRGVGGAVVTFPSQAEAGPERPAGERERNAAAGGSPSSLSPRLWLSAEDQLSVAGEESLTRLRVMVCATCGQHYYEHFVKDLQVTAEGLAGGDAVDTRRVWPALSEAGGGKRVLLIDRLVGVEPEPEEDEDDAVPRSPRHTRPVWLCRYCGALHPQPVGRCDACGRAGELVGLFALESGERYPGRLTMCLACRAPGDARSGYRREPARPVRAVTVSDIHVLSQNMIHHGDRRRLLVFTDNRQDAAFQAGWMKDHARRFRLRTLMDEHIRKASASVGDLVACLDDDLDRDDELSRALIPEVWAVYRKTAEGVKHAEERRYFLRLLVLREIATAIKQRVGLEPLGRIRVDYRGLSGDAAFVSSWADRLGVPRDQLADGVAALLDVYRRGMYLLDREGRIFCRPWNEWDREVQRGYLPAFAGVPKGLKLVRDPADDQARVTQWLSARGDTTAKRAAKAWGVPREHVDQFLGELWDFLTGEVRILAPAGFTTSRGSPMEGCSGAWQIDADLLRIVPHDGLYACTRCRRTQLRTGPNSPCLAWRCNGHVVWRDTDKDNYDLVALEERFETVRPAEHTAQVPPAERERIEHLFKSDSDRLNTLVCTPTLELGIDVGFLDTVLLRNVPPLPANYWQRVGRAGRRLNRLAANITYVRDVTHDRAYFTNPMKLLEGRVEPPRFNLHNELMVAKHVHAAVVARLHRLAKDGGGLSPTERARIAAAVEIAFPRYIREYLFDSEEKVRCEEYDLAPFASVVAAYVDDLAAHVTGIFSRAWPAEESDVVAPDVLRGMIVTMPDRLRDVVRTLGKRLNWAMGQMTRLDDVRRVKGTLDPDEESLFKRCYDLVGRLKGEKKRPRTQAEGYDETNTFSVLAAEGFLPGYGLETGSVLGTAAMPRTAEGMPDFALPRPSGVALREYVPGNLIYANGHRFVARYFHLEPVTPLEFQVDTAAGAVVEVESVGGATGAVRSGVDHPVVTEGGPSAVGRAANGKIANGSGYGSSPSPLATLGRTALKAVPVCDVELAHVSHISDEEDYRFQLPVAIYGYEVGRHGPGVGYTWGSRQATFRRSVRLRLVNVGAQSRVDAGRLGYPVCLASGQSRSPLASERELEEFSAHQMERYGTPVQDVGFYADVVADALCIPELGGREQAYSLLEALRTGMTHVLEMERDDLDILVVGKPGRTEVDAILYDPMPGGSGLLQQACSRWPDLVDAALAVTGRCPGVCERSCVDCLQTFRNAFYHRHLNRHSAHQLLQESGVSLRYVHDIPPRLPVEGPRRDALPVNEAEDRLRGMLRRAGFPEPTWHKQITLGPPLGSTSPDCFFPGDDAYEPGVCVYLDGLSEHIHGNPHTAARDRAIRDQLRGRGYEVLEIPASDLDDREAMGVHFFRLARVLLGKERAREIREGHEKWFREARVGSKTPPEGPRPMS